MAWSFVLMDHDLLPNGNVSKVCVLGERGQPQSFLPSFCLELKTFYTWFEASSTFPAVKLQLDSSSCTLTTSEPDMIRSFRTVNPHKAPGPDGIHGHVLKAWASQLAQVFTDIFNLSLRLSVILTCFKEITIVPVPKMSAARCLNDYHPVGLTSTIMKWF